MQEMTLTGGGPQNRSDIVNAALFSDASDPGFVAEALQRVPGPGQVLVVSNNSGFLRGIRAAMRLSSSEIGLDRDPVAAAGIATALRRWLGDTASARIMAVDMSWVAGVIQGSAAVEAWGDVADGLADALGLAVISIYDRELLIEEQGQAAFQAHRQFAARSGLHENPFWVPADLRRAPVGEQMSFILGRVAPDYAGRGFFERDDRFAARGADPDWLARPRRMAVTPHRQERWHIYCFGQLRVYRDGRDRIEWKIKGGAPRKTRTLFAYLLTHGEKGAHADRIAELLWPGAGSEEGKRARLHHTVAMLRKTLGHRDSVLRSGDFYRLNPPEGSWIDITTFEQLCRRGVSLFKRGQRDEAQQIYRTAEQLYVGDLFQDIPLGYVEGEQEDWCMPRRIWLREMALKLQRDFSALLREQGRLREALEHCQKALAIDPASDDANIEAMRVFHAQGRIDTVARQYRQYKTAMESIGATPEGSEVHSLFLALTRR